MYLKNGRYNLLSVTKIINSGWKLEGNEKSISLVKENKKLTFDIKIHTTRGVFFAVKIDKRTEIAGIVKEGKKVKEVTSMEAHQYLGHLSQQSTKGTAKKLGWHLTGEFVKCEDCAIGKGCQKNVNKRSDHEIAGMVGERIFLDVASVQEQQKFDNYMEPTQKQYWQIMVDEKSQFKISDFFSTKKTMIEPNCEKLFKLKSQGKSIKYIRCD
jgi:hypothetical protein